MRMDFDFHLQLMFDIWQSNMQWERLPGKQKGMLWRKTSDFCP
jgi:hypothetical protein